VVSEETKHSMNSSGNSVELGVCVKFENKDNLENLENG
jgi:hypothetical protein